MHVHTSEQERLELGIDDYSCNWGVHIAGLYETSAERDEMIFGFLARGVDDGDLQLYVPSERSEVEFRASFAEEHPGIADRLEDPRFFQTPGPRELYYPDGTFMPKRMDDTGEAFFAASQAEGPRNIRATTEMVWALDNVPGREHLLAYEARLNYFIPPKPWISICLYNVTKFDGATIMGVLRTHPYVISKGVLTENPYFQDPAEWLRENAPQFL